MKNNKGITLIALVVTIIVLLILAAVSIAMLTGDNGILTNAKKTSTENAYRGAEEQAKLAYMAVRTEIMAKTVADGDYKPEDDEKHLASVAYADVYGNSKWSVSYDTTENIIYLKYEDSAIDKGVIETKENVNIANVLTTVYTPAYEGKVIYAITLENEANGKKQTCSIAYDITEPASLGTAAALNE